MWRFDLYHVLHCLTELLNAIVNMEDTLVAKTDPTLSFISRVTSGVELTVRGHKPFRNHFANPKGFLSPDGAIAFHVTVIPDCTDITVTKIQCIYMLPHLSEYLQEYVNVNTISSNGGTSEWCTSTTKMKVWYKFRIQQHSSFRLQYITKSQAIWADPRTDKGPYGLHDIVLLGDGDNTRM